MKRHYIKERIVDGKTMISVLCNQSGLSEIVFNKNRVTCKKCINIMYKEIEYNGKKIKLKDFIKDLKGSEEELREHFYLGETRITTLDAAIHLLKRGDIGFEIFVMIQESLMKQNERQDF